MEGCLIVQYYLDRVKMTYPVFGLRRNLEALAPVQASRVSQVDLPATPSTVIKNIIRRELHSRSRIALLLRHMDALSPCCPCVLF